MDLRHAAQLVIEIAYADAGLGRRGTRPGGARPAAALGTSAARGQLAPAEHGARGGGTASPAGPAPAAAKWSRSAGSRSSSRCGSRSLPTAAIDPAQEAWLLARPRKLLGSAPMTWTRMRAQRASAETQTGAAVSAEEDCGPSGSRASATTWRSRQGTARTRWRTTSATCAGWPSSRGRRASARRRSSRGPLARLRVPSQGPRPKSRQHKAIRFSHQDLFRLPDRRGQAEGRSRATGSRARHGGGSCPRPSRCRRSTPCLPRPTCPSRWRGATGCCSSWRTAPGCGCPSSAAWA